MVAKCLVDRRLTHKAHRERKGAKEYSDLFYHTPSKAPRGAVWMSKIKNGVAHRKCNRMKKARRIYPEQRAYRELVVWNIGLFSNGFIMGQNEDI